jgi:hypothetical protein
MTIPTRSAWRLPLCRALLALPICLALPASFASPAAAVQPAQGERVDGGNLTRAGFAGGWYEQNSSGWIEYGRDGGPRFHFQETGRDEWSVYLIDRSRNVAIQLDVYRRMVTYSENGGRRSDLYPITDVSALGRGGYAEGPTAGEEPNRGDYAVTGGFYVEQGRPEVMFQLADGLYCHVQNPDQMRAYGGDNQIRRVRHLALRGTSTGDCGWPNGFYRRAREPAVYRLYGRGQFALGRQACHVINPPQMEAFGGFGQLAVIDQGSDLFRGREQPDECTDPD